jgi:hypothetical protein
VSRGGNYEINSTTLYTNGHSDCGHNGGISNRAGRRIQSSDQASSVKACNIGLLPRNGGRNSRSPYHHGHQGISEKIWAAETGILDSATLAKLDAVAQPTQAQAAPQTPPAAQSTTVSDWRSVPTQDELDKLTAKVNDPGSPFTDYRPNAPAANLDLPGAAIVAAMKTSSDTFGSGPPGTAKSTPKTHNAMTTCLNTRPTHWPDIAIHYYCQMANPRQCFTYALRGQSTPGGKKYSRTEAYKACATGTVPYAPLFAFVTKTQPQIFQYVMFAQTNAFKPEQEQAIINAFYGVTNPADPRECR